MKTSQPAGEPALRIDGDKNIWLDVTLNTDWKATYRLFLEKGRVVVGELRVFPRARPLRVTPGAHGVPEVLTQQPSPVPLGGLSTRLLRQVRLGHAIHSVAQIVEYVGRTHPEALERDGYFGRAGLNAASAVPVRRPKPGRGRPALPTESYASLAAAYAAAVARGSRRPVYEIAKELSEPVARIRSRVQKARQLGLLDRGVQGNAGGKLTPAAKRLLKAKGGQHGKTTRKR
jgi:hypothetical protein